MELNDKTLYWLAGYLEGEGSFIRGTPSNPNQPAIAVTSTDEDVIRKVANIFGVSYWRATGKKRLLKTHWKPAYFTRVRCSRAVALMNLLHPLMGQRRREQIERALASYTPHITRKLSDDQVREILSIPADKRESPEALARKYGVSRWTIRNVLERKERFAAF
jgi:hypothetical protein